MDNKENKTEENEMTPEELEKAAGGSWLGIIWNKIKSFGGGSGSIDINGDGEDS